MVTENTFHAADYSIFSITIVISLGIGLYYALSGGRQKTTSEVLVGNRQMKTLPVAISLMVSFESSIMMLGIPAEVYAYGIQWFISMIGLFIANIVAVKVLVPVIHPLKITSAYEYLELRFKSHACRLVGTVLGILSYLCYMGVVLFGPGIALEAVTGFSRWISILLVAIAAVLYTAIGGIKAVIWTDVFQAVIMYTGMIAVLVKGTIEVGGVGKTWQIANENGRLNFFNFDTNPLVRHTFWNLFFGSLIRGVGLIFNQSTIQRISSTPTLKEARKVILITAPAFMIVLGFAAIEGIIAYSYYHTKGCDPLAAKKIRNTNQIIPFFVMDIFEGLPGLPGLFLASLFSASLSTLSSGLSSMSALLWTDIIKPHTKPMSEFKATVVVKLCVVMFGFLCIAIALLVSVVGGTLNQISGTIISAFAGPLSGLFLLAAYCPFANSKGAITSTLLSVGLTTWIATGQYMSKAARRWQKLPPGPIDQCFNINHTMAYSSFTDSYAEYMSTPEDFPLTTTPIPPPEGINVLYSISYLWLSPIGIFTVLILGALISLLTGPIKGKDSNPIYLVSFVDEFMCYLPSSMRKLLRCGVQYDRRKEFYEARETMEILITPEKEDQTNLTTEPLIGKDIDVDFQSGHQKLFMNGSVSMEVLSPDKEIKIENSRFQPSLSMVGNVSMEVLSPDKEIKIENSKFQPTLSMAENISMEVLPPAKGSTAEEKNSIDP